MVPLMNFLLALNLSAKEFISLFLYICFTTILPYDYKQLAFMWSYLKLQIMVSWEQWPFSYSFFTTDMKLDHISHFKVKIL